MMFYYRQRHHPGVQGTGSAVPEFDSMVGSEQSGKAVRFALLLALSAILVLTAAPTFMTEGSHATGTEQGVPLGETDGGEQTDTSTGEGDEGSGQEGADSDTPVMCAVTFKVTPEDAVIVVYGEGQTYLFENGVRQEIPYGEYEYVITADGYEPTKYTLELGTITELIVIEKLEPDSDSPVKFTQNTLSVYTTRFYLPYEVPDGITPKITFTPGVTYDPDTKIVTISGNETTIAVEMTAEYEGKTYTDYLTILVNTSDEAIIDPDITISATETARDEAVSREDQVMDIDAETIYKVYLDISSVSESKDSKTIDITEILKQMSRVDNMEFGYGHDEYEVLAVHFGENSVDYPEVEIIGGQVYVTVSEFSTYGFYIYLAQEHTAFDPVYPPWSEDDDYVPFPPIVVEEAEDNSVEVVACAAAAVVAALMAAFLIIDRRKG